MSSNWTSSLKLELIGTGEQAGTWGQTTNDNFQYALEQAIVGTTNVAFSSADVDLTLTDSNSSQTARFLRLNLTGTSAGARTLYLSTGANVQKTYIVNNNLLDTITVQNKINNIASGTSVAVPSGKTMWIYNTGTNVVEVVSHLGSLTLSTALPVASGGTGGTTQSAARTGLGATTVGGNFFTLTNPSAVTFPRINADNSISTLDAATFRTAIGAGAGTVTSVGGTGTVNGLTLTGTVTSSGSLTLGGTLANVNLASAVTGTLPIANGGTGGTSFTANNVLLGNGTSSFQTVAPGANGNILTSNGTTWTSAPAPAGGVISFSAGTTGLTPNTATTGAVTLGGTLDVDNGGTGQTSYTNGQLLIGNSTGNTLAKATLTAGTGISITNGAGSITIATPNADVQTFSGNGTWTKPSSGTMARIQVWGGGGGGAGFSSTACGGGGGGYNEVWKNITDLGSSETVTVGAGGAGASFQANNATSGGNSSFGSHCIAYGGSKGDINVAGGGGGGQLSAGAVGINGSPAVSRHWEGGQGSFNGSAGSLQNSVFGGAGGGDTSAGGVASGGVSVYGGNGGSAGVAGSAPGGGGGGAISIASTSGAAGRVVVTVF